MSRKRRQRTRADAPERSENRGISNDEGLRFTRWTGIYGGAGLLFAGLGFLLLAQGSINLAPVLLLVGFLVFFPLALVK